MSDINKLPQVLLVKGDLVVYGVNRIEVEVGSEFELRALYFTDQRPWTMSWEDEVLELTRFPKENDVDFNRAMIKALSPGECTVSVMGRNPVRVTVRPQPATKLELISTGKFNKATTVVEEDLRVPDDKKE